MTAISFLVGLVVGALLVVVFSKNNKNTIARLRTEILAAADKGEAEIKKVIEKYNNK